MLEESENRSKQDKLPREWLAGAFNQAAERARYCDLHELGDVPESPTEQDQHVHEFIIKLRVPKDAFIVNPPPPATVSQRNCFDHFGIPPRTFLRWARDGLFPSKKIGKLRFASYDDVFRAVHEGAEWPSRSRPTTPHQKRAEIVPDVVVPHHGRDHVGTGYYRKCTWCDRPAYATKQEWIFDREYWSGGPVCEVCAWKRQAHERVVGPSGEVLLPTRDPASHQTESGAAGEKRSRK